MLSFDVWGSRRDGYDGSAIPLGELTAVFDQKLATTVTTSSFTTKGYTGHEMLVEVGLIHMNSRVYNPTIARFVSADPLISNPDNTQSYNRYSYVQNRSMFYTDPSGFESVNDDCYCDVFYGELSGETRAAESKSRSSGATGVKITSVGEHLISLIMEEMV